MNGIALMRDCSEWMYLHAGLYLNYSDKRIGRVRFIKQSYGVALKIDTCTI